MKALIKSLVMLGQKRYIRFGIVGAFVALTGFLVLSFGVEVLKLTPQWANVVQAGVAIELNFWLNNHFTWSDRRHTSLLTRWSKYHLGKILSVGVNQLLFFILVSVLGVYYLVAYVVNVGLVTILNFLINEKFVFRQVHSQKGKRSDPS